MKKLVVLLFVFLLYIPVNALELSFKNTKIGGATTVKEGDQFTLTFSINFNGFDKDSYDTDGILGLLYEINFDDEVLDVVKIDSNKAFDSNIYKVSNNSYIVESMITDNIPKTSKCINSLYCDNYKTDITFYAKKVKKANVSVGEIAVLYVNLMDFENNLDNLDNLEPKILEGQGDAILNININENESSKSEAPASIIDETKKDVSLDALIKEEKITKIEENEEKEETKSDNNYLKSLVIEGYNLDFDKEVKLYDLEIKDDVNSLNVQVETMDKDATYKIIGADNLKENSYKIVVEVTAPNQEVRKYTISLKNKNLEARIEDEKPKDEFKIDKKYLKLGGIILGSIIILILIILLIRKIYDKNVEKNLKNL